MGRVVQQQSFADRLARAEGHEADGRPFRPFSMATAPDAMMATNARGAPSVNRQRVALKGGERDETGELVEGRVGEAGEKLRAAEPVADGGSRHGRLTMDEEDDAGM